jgi:hypothetical protein
MKTAKCFASTGNEMLSTFVSYSPSRKEYFKHSMMDRHCLISAVLFLLSDIIACVVYFMTKNQQHFDFSLMKNLDPAYIQHEWEWHIEHGRIENSYEIINAIAWFIFAIPGAFPFHSNGDDSMGLYFFLI